MEINESPVVLLLNTRVDTLRKDLPDSLRDRDARRRGHARAHVCVTSDYSVETSDAERIAVDQVAKILTKATNLAPRLAPTLTVD